ncbi:MAG: pentapeptide repeat-containing protein [Pseudomonadota bacterium]
MTQDLKPQLFDIDTKEKLDAWTGDIAAWNDWGAEHLGEDFKPIDPDLPLHPLLKGEAAMALWRAGREGWNAWVSRNPIADVYFDSQIFEAQEDSFGNPLVDFSQYKFPEGNVSFVLANFGKGEVRFNHATFGKGDVNFSHANFGEGDVNFSHANFGEGDVYFGVARFGDGYVSFNSATFGEGIVLFTSAMFGEGDVIFDYVTFGEGNVDFVYANFDEGNLRFNETTFGKGNINFRRSSFGSGKVSFDRCVFEGAAHFTSLQNVGECEVFSFEGCSFEKLFTFSNTGTMGCPLDLRRTKISHTPVVHDIKCEFATDPDPLGRWPTIAANREDSQRFRRLKELAVANRNHAKALEFHALEIQTARGHGTTFLQDLGQFLYWITSDYGRSVKRPLGWLFTVCILWAGLLWNLRQPVTSFPNDVRERIGEATPEFWTALIYSASNMLSFIPTGRTARTQSEDLLFGGFVPEYIIALNGVQTVLSVILLFLLSLGLRNMFRV